MKRTAEEAVLLRHGVTHLLNYVIRVVVKGRHKDPVAEMGRILKEGEVRMEPAELLRFVLDVDNKELVDRVMSESAPAEVDPRGSAYWEYHEACVKCIEKLGMQNIHLTRSTSLGKLCGILARAKQDLPLLTQPSAVKIIFDVAPLLPGFEDFVSKLISQLSWLFDGTLWTWQVVLVGNDEQLAVVERCILTEGGLVVTSGYKLFPSHQEGYWVFMDGSLEVHPAAVGSLLAVLQDDRSIAGVLGCEKVGPKGAVVNTSLEDSMAGTLLKGLCSSQLLDNMGCLWSRMAVFRESSLTLFSTPLLYHTSLHLELTPRLLNTLDRLGERKKTSPVVYHEVPHLMLPAPPPVPDISVTTWTQIANAVASELSRKTPTSSKWHHICTNEAKLKAFKDQFYRDGKYVD
eukprot:TRINITY_DN10211_c0_g1_i1.p1 TRINITY_DN10211_c0_g1~~TRINITY_DN10211_c0_g1_i1.p1  ORF type:complete len:403 (+),score=59.32 TRINITY_DN10211_c0_g1_i1:421-1629(+)